MSLSIRSLSPAGGAEIVGAVLRDPPDDAAIAAIEAAWHEHVVIVARDQELDEAQQLAFAARFGKVGSRTRPKERRAEIDDYDGAVMLVTNQRDEAGRFIGSIPEGELWFHHDMSYKPEPHKATMLHAIAIPSTGGNTRIANMYKAYDNVPVALKRKLAGRRVLQAYDFAFTEAVNIDDGLDRLQHCWQPVFVRHPATGRTALYVSRLMSALIEGLPRSESDAILAELFDIAEDPAIIYEHVWRKGDLVMWDNRCSIHARTDFPPEELRLLRRCTVEGGPMIAAAV